jgi:uncharacterized protein YjiK
MFLPRKFHFRRYFVPFLMLACLFGAACWYWGWFEIAAYRLSIEASDESQMRLGLEDYRVGIDALPLAGIEKNVSGLTYHLGRNNLFAVINRPPQIVELTLDGRLKRSLPVKGAMISKAFRTCAATSFSSPTSGRSD